MANNLFDEFVFYSEKLNYKTAVGTKGKEYFVEGYISTGDIDLVNDIVTKDCMNSMLNQFSDRTIKLDFEHETFRGKSKLDAEANKTRIPLGKAVSQKQDSKGVIVKWQMNPTWKKFDEKGNVTMTFKDVWDNVETEMYDAFSIAYVPTSTKSIDREGKSIRLLDHVNLLNVALTGNAINPAATMTAVMAKSLEFMKDQEGDNMENIEIKDSIDKIEAGIEELKTKYIKRTGSSGNYKYTYPGDNKPRHKPGSSNKLTNGKLMPDTQKMIDKYGYKPKTKSEEQLFQRANELNLTTEMADLFIKSHLSDSNVDKEKTRQTKMVDKKDELPEAEAPNPETSDAGKEAEATAEPEAGNEAEAPAEPEAKAMTLTELKSVVETLAKDVKALKEENADLKAIVEKPLQKAKGAENKEAKSQEADVKSFGGPMDLIA